MRGLLFMLLLFVAVTAISSGALLIAWPDGSMVGLSRSILEGSPFTDFVLPGLLLVFGVGGVSLSSLFMVAGKRSYGYQLTIASGIILGAFVVGQLAMLPEYHWLQAFYLMVALLIILLAIYQMGKALL